LSYNEYNYYNFDYNFDYDFNDYDNDYDNTTSTGRMLLL
jgi:hypothetical protein